MTRSQLRKLAVDFAEGLLAADEYRARRRELIDAIVDGDVAIERDAPVVAVTLDRAVPGAPSLRAKARSTPALASLRLPGQLPWPLILGGASALCILALLVLLLWPAGEPPKPALTSVPVQGLPRARTLVESFLARRDFEASAIGTFEQRWLALDRGERDEARSALWFGALVRALRDEVKTQKALADLGSGDAALERARRVRALAETLGVAEQLPEIDTVTALPPPVPAAGLPAAAQAAAQAAAAPATAPAATGADTATSVRVPTGREWLGMQDDAALTLQLFAVNQLDRVEQLIAAHPDLPVNVLATDGAAPRYRVFHGVYGDAAGATAAFEALPEDITTAAGGAIVKSFAAVREDLAARTTDAPARTAAVPPVAPAAPAAPARAYTLQLFASTSRSNARSLVQAFPDIALALREVIGDPVPFRVVYGSFDSVDAARSAGRQLPAALRAKVGEPLVKSIAETGRAVQP